MTSGAKVAIGCAAVVVVGMMAVGIAAVMAVVGGGMWVKGKTQAVIARAETLEKLKNQVDAYPFTAPAGDLIADDRLVAYLEVRKTMQKFLLARGPEIAEINEKNPDPNKPPSLSDMTKTVRFLADHRETFYSALIDQKMNEAEYQWMMIAVYRATFASEFERESGGKKPSEATAETVDQVDAALATMEKQKDGANLPPEFKQSMEGMSKEFSRLAAMAKSGSKDADVPQANIEAVRRHQDDIRQYALSGTEMYGL